MADGAQCEVCASGNPVYSLHATSLPAHQASPPCRQALGQASAFRVCSLALGLGLPPAGGKCFTPAVLEVPEGRNVIADSLSLFRVPSQQWAPGGTAFGLMKPHPPHKVRWVVKSRVQVLQWEHRKQRQNRDMRVLCPRPSQLQPSTQAGQVLTVLPGWAQRAQTCLVQPPWCRTPHAPGVTQQPETPGGPAQAHGHLSSSSTSIAGEQGKHLYPTVILLAPAVLIYQHHRCSRPWAKTKSLGS